MREIKFRAYDKENKKMVCFDFNNIYGYEGEVCGVILPDTYTVLTYDTGRDKGFNKNLEIMQYTGLKDKNGKEIYEGDILKTYFKKGSWKYNDKNYYGYKNGKVEYCVDCFILYIENYKEKIYPLSSFGNNNKNIVDLEIIGNIYDNPELLKEE